MTVARPRRKPLGAPTSAFEAGWRDALRAADKAHDAQLAASRAAEPALPKVVEPAGGLWSIVREEVAAPRHMVSVYLLHETGARVPLGPNLHPRDRAPAEAARLVRVLDWPKRA